MHGNVSRSQLDVRTDHDVGSVRRSCGKISDEFPKDRTRALSSDFENETTSYDGLVFASSKKVNPIFEDFKHLGRTEICKAKSSKLLEYLVKLN